MSSIAVIGAGHVGIVTAAAFAELGHSVVCADIDAARVADLVEAELPIFEPGLGDLVQRGFATGQLSFVVGAAAAATGADFVFLCLQTPATADGSPDMSFVLEAVSQVAPALAPGAVLVTKSTVPIGAAEQIDEWVGRSDIAVASNPEFLREGSAVADVLGPDRIVIGAASVDVANAVVDLYQGLPGRRIVTDTRSAELIKYASNAFLAMKLSYVNALDTLCHEAGANSSDVLAGIAADPRIGSSFMTPGPGFGGSCFPKDVVALARAAADRGVDFSLLRSTIAMNDARMDWVVERVKDAAGGVLTGRTIGVLGIAYKAGTNDVRESPAVGVIHRLLQAGALVRAFDPEASMPNGEGLERFLAVPDERAAIDRADAVVVLTEWAQFGSDSVRQALGQTPLVDMRRVLASDRLALDSDS